MLNDGVQMFNVIYLVSAANCFLKALKKGSQWCAASLRFAAMKTHFFLLKSYKLTRIGFKQKLQASLKLKRRIRKKKKKVCKPNKRNEH